MNSALKGKRVLVVEDSPTQLMHLQHLLESNGLFCIVADNGQLGLSLAQSLLPDIIIMDLEMPQMNGFQVFQKLKQLRDTAQIPVILLTKFNEAEFVKLGHDMGMVEFIPKDAFADVVLVETLKQMKIVAA